MTRVEHRLNILVDAAEPMPGVDDAVALLRPLGGLVAVEVRDDLEGPSAIGVRLVAADEMQRLNQTFRKKDYVANVLSFPAEGDTWDEDDKMHYLGDVAICPDKVVEEAENQGKTVADHLRHLALHGVLHILGYDHENAEDAAVMEALEIRILADWGIEDPYADGSPVPDEEL
ncbi:MAG TPA: rRNA maturation RNase YbeY [Alphaproteobacteria bacterium]|nr:rRNA maturation RNase YbeY [Alphaproteobacteria bacterium]